MGKQAIVEHFYLSKECDKCLQHMTPLRPRPLVAGCCNSSFRAVEQHVPKKLLRWINQS
jgi:hypothetical protein